MDGNLEAVLIFVEQTFDLDEVILLEGVVDRILDVIPHFGFELTGPITQDQRQIRFAGFLSA